jgi:hypothetical protein
MSMRERQIANVVMLGCCLDCPHDCRTNRDQQSNK